MAAGSFYKGLCARLGLDESASTDAVLRALDSKLAEGRTAMALALAARKPADTNFSSSGAKIDGVQPFTAEEAQDYLAFTLARDPVSRRRAEVTELSTGRTLAEALRAGMLK